MKKIYSLIYCLVTLLLAGCTNEPLVDLSEGRTIQSLNASMADLATSRSHLENGTSVVWDNGDVLGVFSDVQEQAVPYFYNGDGTTFSGDKVSGNVFYAFYPYAEFAPEGSRIRTTLEKEFWYKENTYSRRCPMVAKSTDNNFKLLQTCGIVKLSMTGTWRLSRIILKGNNNEILAGTGTIDAASDAPVLTIPADAGDASTSLLMYTDVNLKKDVPTEFFFIVPVQTLAQGLSFTITGYAEGSFAETTVTKSTNKKIEVSRAVVKSFTAIDTDDLLAEEPDDDRTALMALYNALGGTGWTNHENWGSDKPLSQWHGVQVEDNRVTALYLMNNNLTGEIPSEIGNLTSLKTLYISSNNIRGILPVSMGNLKNLENMYFNDNNLSGDIPAEITALPCWVTCGWGNVMQKRGYRFTFSTLKLSVLSFAQQDLMTQEKLNNTLIIVMLNSTKYAGTCHMSYYPSWTTDYGEGNSIAYFPVGESDEALANVLHHEAGGHGFAKLADEYFYDNDPLYPESEKQRLQSMARLGWYKNVDVTSDPAAVHWRRFISDAAYAPEKVGVYEGGYTYPRGFYRPTETGIMRYNVGGFNAPSREMIYYRIHKLAYGADWTYNYNEFKNWDAKNIREHAARTVAAVPKNFVPLAPPVVKVMK